MSRGESHTQNGRWLVTDQQLPETIEDVRQACIALFDTLIAEAEEAFPFQHCMTFDEDQQVWLAVSDWLRQRQPSLDLTGKGGEA